MGRSTRPQFCAKALVYASDVSVTEWSPANLVVAAHRYRRLRDGAELVGGQPAWHPKLRRALLGDRRPHHPPPRLRHLATASRRRSVGQDGGRFARYYYTTRWIRSLPCHKRTREQSFECIMAIGRRLRPVLQEFPRWATPYCVLASCYTHLGFLGDAEAIARRLNGTLPVPNAAQFRDARHRKLLGPGLKLAGLLGSLA